MKLSLGHIPSKRTVRISLLLPAVLKDQLEQYAHLYNSQSSEAIEPCALIPYILERFFAKDKAFQEAIKKRTPVPASTDP